MQTISKILKYISNNILESFIFILTALNILPILAPLLAKIGWYWPAKAIYTLYSLFCHQLHWRSLHVCDYQYGWCSRCTFMWLNILLSALAVKLLNLKKIKWYWAAVLIAPMALDGIVQTVATMLGFASFTSITYMSSNFMRMFTGSLFGLGFGLYIFTNLNEVVLQEKNLKAAKPAWGLLRFVLISMLTSLLVYVSLVLIWDSSSSNYKPENIFDFSVRTPAQTQDFIVRGKNAL
jgi:uncharacterized membrane protein